MRKESTITLTDGGEQKIFKIRQMPASKAERWVYKLVLLLGSGASMNVLTDPAALFAALNEKPYDKVQELLDDLLSCVSRCADGGIETQLTNDNVDGFVEEMITLMKLRVEAFKANHFFPQVGAADLAKFSEAMIKRQG